MSLVAGCATHIEQDSGAAARIRVACVANAASDALTIHNVGLPAGAIATAFAIGNKTGQVEPAARAPLRRQREYRQPARVVLGALSATFRIAYG